MLTRTSSLSLTEQLAQRFSERIKNRLLAPGARLPSVRQCAEQQGVSASTVVAAYDQLLAQGLVEARKQRGFYVRNSPAAQVNPAALAPINIANQSGTAERLVYPFNATALIRGMFHPASDKPQPGLGVLPREWMESSFMPAAVRKVTSTQALNEFSLQYGEALGDTGLRLALAHKLSAFDVLAAPSQIITTVGATHALDIVSRSLLRAGDPVMVEEPGWAVEFARLAALGMRVLPVPRGPNGPNLAVMQQYCEAYRPKLYVSVSVLHNPTGYCLNPASAHQVLQLANRYDFHIVEDDTYCHLAPEHALRLCALDGLQRTIYVSGFAKILAPNWRLGFMAAPAALVEQLLDTKLLGTLTTPALLEKAMALCITQGHLRRHAERIRTLLAQARSRSVKLALNAGCNFAAEPAGLFGWVDTGVDTDALAQTMLDEGYLLAPGSLFHAQRQASTLMRINFATTQSKAFWEVFERVRAKV